MVSTFGSPKCASLTGSELRCDSPPETPSPRYSASPALRFDQASALPMRWPSRRSLVSFCLRFDSAIRVLRASAISAFSL
jgi:hypothetical protein